MNPTCSRAWCDRPPAPGRKLCAACAAYHRAYHRRQYARRKAAGLCVVAGCGPAVAGRAYCVRHKLYFGQAGAKHRANKRQTSGRAA